MMKHLHRCGATRGFTLVELMIVISIILVLMGMVVAIGPAIMNEVHKVATLSKLNMLEQAIVRYNNKYDTFPPDSEIGEGNKVDNEKFLEVMDEFGIKEESMLDGWGNAIVYDRVRDEDGNLEINKDLPNDPRDEKILDAGDEDEEEIYQKFFLWSQGPDPKSGIPRQDLLKEH